MRLGLNAEQIVHIAKSQGFFDVPYYTQKDATLRRRCKRLMREGTLRRIPSPTGIIRYEIAPGIIVPSKEPA